MRTHVPASLAALLALAACSPSFDGPEKVQGLRLLALQAEPPEIGAPADGSGPGWPAGATALRSLVAHPTDAVDAAAQAVVLHLGCTPVPGDPAGTACTALSELSQPEDLLGLVDATRACAAPGQGTVGAITFSGLEACGRDGCVPFSVPLDPDAPGSAVPLPAPSYTLPPDLSLSALPAGNTQRLLGLDVVDLALVVEASPAELAPATAVPDACAALGAVLGNLQALWPTRANLAALKWIHVRGPDMPAENPANRNPTVSGIRFGGALLPAPGTSPAAATAGATEKLLPDFGAGSYETLRERYQRYDTDGQLLDTRDETWAYSWFTTGGELDRAHTDSTDPEDSLKPKHGRAVVWLVVRDLRGGMAWTAGEIEAP
jgi:hypothetical protein